MPTAKCKIPSKLSGKAASYKFLSLDKLRRDIRCAKRTLGLSNEAIATRTGVNATCISKFLLGETSAPRAETIQKFCTWLSDTTASHSAKPQPKSPEILKPAPSEEPERPRPVIQYEVEPWPVMNFSFRGAPHAKRI